MTALSDGAPPNSKYARLSTTTVTALAFIDKFVLAGEGNILKCYQRENTASSCSLSVPLFEAQAIHGVLVVHLRDALYTIIAWGGAQVRVLLTNLINAPSSSPSSVQIIASRLITADDWILSCQNQGHAQIIDDNRQVLHIAAVTAHNALLCLKINLEGQGLGLSLSLDRLSASSRVLLYAAALRWLDPTRILIAAGSALGDIIIWSCEVVRDDASGTLTSRALTKHYDYPSHDGSVFGLDVGLLPDVDGGERLLVASCSDDRTIRIWNVSDALTTGSSSAYKTVPLDDQQAADAKAATCVAKTWAHTSRIWQVKFVAAHLNIALDTQLFSFGEDGTCQLWTLGETTTTSQNATMSLSHDYTFSNHVGKNIWSSAMNYTPDAVHVATGGADSAVVVLEMPRRISATTKVSRPPQQWTKDELASVVVPGMHKDHPDIAGFDSAAATPKAYSFVSEDQVLLITSGGQVLLGEMSPLDSADLEMTWRYLTTIPSKSYSVTAGLPSLALGLIGDAYGDVYAFVNGHFGDKPILHVTSKIGGLFLQTLKNVESTRLGSADTSQESDDDLVLLVSRLGHTKANLFRVSARTLAKHEEDELQSSIELELPKGMVITSMLFQPLNSAQHLLFIGSRNGYVACFLLAAEYTLLSCTPHHADAVTALTWRNASPGSDHGYLMTTGRDSCYAIHRYHFREDTLDPLLVHRTVLPFGPNIEGLYFTEGPQPHLIFYGFQSKDFLVYDETEHNEIFRIECGGAHRVWAFHPSLSLNGASMRRFLWTRASTLCMFSSDASRRNRPKRGGHGREVKAVAVRPQQSDVNPDGRDTIIATGAEDTDIRLFRLSSSAKGIQPEMKCISIISKHTTGLQQIKWSEDGQYLFSAAGCEEFFVWRVREVPFVQTGIVCEFVLPPASELPDLRIMAFDVTQVDRRGSKAQNDVEAEFIITIVLSDSTLRVYRYTSSPRIPKWQLLQDGRHTTCCFTQVVHPDPPGQSFDLSTPFPILTASTDGHISIWNMDLIVQDQDLHSENTATAIKLTARPYHTLQVHQNAITCMQHILISTYNLEASSSTSTHSTHFQTHLLITGGDDNALAFTRLTTPLTPSTPLSTSSPQTSTLLIPRAHAAALRGIAITSQRQSGSVLELDVMTASNDQRVRTWRVIFDMAREGVEGLEVRRGKGVYTAVADVAGVDVLRRDGRKGERIGSEGEEVGEGRGGKEREEVEGVVVCGVGIDVLPVGR